jgi:hypothetical protein
MHSTQDITGCIQWGCVSHPTAIAGSPLRRIARSQCEPHALMVRAVCRGECEGPARRLLLLPLSHVRFIAATPAQILN